MSKTQLVNVDNLIKLSGFNISPDEKEKFEKELEDFLGYAKVIQEAGCDELPPFTNAVEKPQYIREDNPKNWGDPSNILFNAPLIEKTNFIVPPQKGRTGGDEDVKEELTVKQLTDEYETVIGLEIHAQLKTKSKIFCSCLNKFGSEPNVNTCPVCTGQPGTLPVLNEEVVNMAIKAGLATNCTINENSVFARKNYFYPDLSKGYQISQFEFPICTDGLLEIEVDGEVKKIRLNRIHIEEDPGKMIHIGAPGIWGSKASAVDYNRSGVPLIEIVSEPDMRSPKEAKEYVIMIRAILVSLGICDGNLEEGSMRCDANISLRKVGDTELGVKREIKNMNSFKAIERALIYEIEAQKKMLKTGVTIYQETRLWDDNSQKTILMRSKEDAHDYRYFPDPDLMPLKVEKSLVEKIKKEIPPSPLTRKNKYKNDYSLSEDESRLLMINPKYAEYFENILKKYNKPRMVANWFFNELLFYVSSDISTIHIKPAEFADFLRQIDNEIISGKIGKSVLKQSFETKEGLNEIISNNNLKQITDHNEIEKLINAVMEEHHEKVKLYKSGKTKMFGFFVGEVMKKSKGKASPRLVNEILKIKLDEQ